MSQQDETQRQPYQRRERRKRRSPIMGYLVILFAVAFLLLLLAYFQQQRANSEATDALKESVSTVQSIQNLMDDNRALRAENETLSEQTETLENQLKEVLSSVESLTERVTELETAQSQSEQAMDWFWQINEAYVKGRYTLARQMIQTMEDDSDGKTPLKEYLPDQSHTDNNRYSPAKRYAEIYNALY